MTGENDNRSRAGRDRFDEAVASRFLHIVRNGYTMGLGITGHWGLLSTRHWGLLSTNDPGFFPSDYVLPVSVTWGSDRR